MNHVIHLDALQPKIKEIGQKLKKLPALLDDFESKNEEEEGDRLVMEMGKWRENEALKMMKSLKESVAAMEQRAEELEARHASGDSDEQENENQGGIKTLLKGIAWRHAQSALLIFKSHSELLRSTSR